MTDRHLPADERPQMGNMLRVLPDRAKRTLYVRPDYFAELPTIGRDRNGAG